MISPEILAIVMFVTTLGLLLFGFPVAFTLAGTALLFGFLGDALEIFNFRMLGFFPQRIFGTMINEPLVAVPLFIFMGIMLEKTKIAAGLLHSIGELFGTTKGGLGIGVVIVGMLLAASTGIVGATVVTMGMLSLPSMMKAGYDQKIATGTICAAGTLGQIIPPSIVLVLLATILQGANEEAAMLVGNLAPDPVTAIDLFAGAILPGLMLVVLFIIFCISIEVKYRYLLKNLPMTTNYAMLLPSLPCSSSLQSSVTTLYKEGVSCGLGKIDDNLCDKVKKQTDIWNKYAGDTMYGDINNRYRRYDLFMPLEGGTLSIVKKLLSYWKENNVFPTPFGQGKASRAMTKSFKLINDLIEKNGIEDVEKFMSTTDLEKQNLEAHVDLCSERYKGLHDRLSAIELRLGKMNEDMIAGQKSSSKTIIATAGTVVAGLLSTVVVILMKF